MVSALNPRLDLDTSEYGLLTDLYQLTMSLCYCGEGLAQRPASFELFVRRLPPQFGYLIAMGLAQAIDYLENLHFTGAQIKALQETGIFASAPDRFWQLLENCRFTGNVWALPEGTIVFAHEPILRIEAELWQAQLVETYLLNVINYQTMIATKCARIRDVAGADKSLWEFGTRRAFSPQASLWSARSALASGFDGTSNVLAALKLGHKPVGTMAHALVMTLTALAGTEFQAFQAFQRYFPNSPLLIDTFDTLSAAEMLRQENLAVTGVRLDSGDLAQLSQQVAQILPTTKIYASGDLDEYAIQELQAQGASIDGYGIGTKLVTGTPVNGVYKLVEIAGIPVSKKSPSKETYGYRKQIFRRADGGDRLARAESAPKQGETPLLQLFMERGKLIKPLDSLPQIADRVKRGVNALDPTYRCIRNPQSFPVHIAEELYL
jgi:nicotinate phosphoribosyltransferase